ncbi:hypothetical protein QL285_031640 [Trifolium repens]|nr:hypothetical protein QL285_031640 [Trifolium repens]
MTVRSSLSSRSLSPPDLRILIDQIRSQRYNPTSPLTTSTSQASFPSATTPKFLFHETGSSVSPENMIPPLFSSLESLNRRNLNPNLTFSFQSPQQNETTKNPNLALQLP